MASMRDKLVALQGKKIRVHDEGAHISPPASETWYNEIVEVGDDYFVVALIGPPEDMARRKNFPVTYAISVVKRIDGDA